jgi:DDE_Tnp_1-associated/Transposase DDE domain
MPAMTCALVEKRQAIAAPRRQSENLKHPLVDVILLGFCGVLAGGEDFVELATGGHLNEAFLRTFLELPHGIPSPDTCTRVFAMLKPTTLQEVLLPWRLERRGLPGDGMHLDGKTLWRTRGQSQKLKALHVVSAWAGQTGITLGQVAVDAKSKEITALPQLLKLLDLQEKVVTTDAMGCQKTIAETIITGGGDLKSGHIYKAASRLSFV